MTNIHSEMNIDRGCGVCAHFNRIHRLPFPHRFRGAMHSVIERAA
jgi:hypothetical protein